MTKRIAFAMTITLAVATVTARSISNVNVHFQIILALLKTQLTRDLTTLFLALIAGACSLARQDNPKQCLTKAGNKVDSVKKCLAMGCCFNVDVSKSKIACYEQSGTVASVQAV